MMRRFGMIMLAVAGMMVSVDDIKAQQSVTEFNFEVENIENSKKSRLVVNKAFKKKKFEEMEVSYLPQVVKDIISKDFENATPKKAYVKKEEGINLYKIVIEINGQTKDLYSDINGNWTDQEGIEYI